MGGGKEVEGEWGGGKEVEGERREGRRRDNYNPIPVLQQ